LAQNSNPRKRSLILITVDCLRADHCGFYGYSHPTTPFLNTLASESFVVPNAIVGGAPTFYSLPAILASRMPLALGRDVVGLAPGESTIAAVLRESGYATAAFSAGNPYISPRFGYDQGFETFRDFAGTETQPLPNTHAQDQHVPADVRGKLNRSLKGVASSMGLGALYDELYFQYCMKVVPPAASIDVLRRFPAADVLVDQALSWLASVAVEDRPFFLWLHLMDPHSPYYPRNEAFGELTGTDIEPGHARYLNEFWNRSDLKPVGFKKKRAQVIQLYDAGIRWVDTQIARLVAHLQETQLWDECVLALTADHGEEFLEHGGRYHAPVRLHEEIIRVPLLIRVPGVPVPGAKSAKVPASPMSHLHLAPTLVDMIGAEAPPAFQGRSLWQNLQQGIAWDDPALIECAYNCTNPFRADRRNTPRLMGVRESRFKLVMRMEAGATEQIYDLESDPSETRPSAVGGETRKRLLQTARRLLDQTISARDPELRLRARLRDFRNENSHSESPPQNLG
jgi:arylsulfatase A-like enzyme